jgi:hypothetical protein
MPDPTTGVLFVCLGNICRSPLAEGIFIHLARQRGVLGRFRVDSCGSSIAFLIGHQELHGLGAVDDAVVVAEGEVHHRADRDLARVSRGLDGAVLDRVHAEDAGLGRVEDGRGHEAAEDAAVGDGEGAALVISSRVSLPSRARVARSLMPELDVGEGHRLAVAQHGHDQALGCSRRRWRRRSSRGSRSRACPRRPSTMKALTSGLGLQAGTRP